jgi:hypothetical protein
MGVNLMSDSNSNQVMFKKILFLSILCIATHFAQSQTLTYYPWQSQFEISSSPQKTLWLQFRIQGNSVFSSMNTEIAPMITFKKNPKSVFYFGPGAQFNLLNKLNDKDILNGYFLNIGGRSYPFEKYKNVGIVFEISPYSSKDFDIGTWRYLFGVSYSFKKN